MKQILLTLDYELFGNGKGDVFELMIHPTEKILNIAQKYNAKITFFFEVIEYWRLKEEWEKGNSMGYSENPIEAIEQQIIRAVRDGHDVQLHLHPQWCDAIWTDNGWKVNMNDWRLGGYQKDGKYSLENLFARGKQTLEELIKPIKHNYECNAVRAGGYCVQPSEEIVKIMKKYGFKYDTSIYPGGLETGSRQFFDFRNLQNNIGWWYCDDKIDSISSLPTCVIEVPIVGLDILRIRKFLSWNRIIGILKNRKNATETLAAKTDYNSGVRKKASIFDKIKFFFQIECQTWDFCLLSKSLHADFIKKIETQKERSVFVMVGHPKSLLSDGKNMDWVLDTLSKKGYRFPAMCEIKIL